METKCHSSSSRLPSRHDRSRSPCRERRPWEQGGEPKSVLYSADVQFHQRRMLQRSRRSPMKQSPSPIKNRTTKSATSSPLKDTSTHTALRAHHWDSEQSLQNVANRWQRWHQMYSPPKFMAGLRSGDGHSPDSKPSRNTPKRRGNRPWSVSYPWNDAEIFDENCDYENHSIEKSHPSKENIRRIEKPRVRNRSTSHTMLPERSNLNHITTHQRIRSKSPALEENHRDGNVEPVDARAPVTVTPMQDSFSSPLRQDPVEQLTPGTAISPGEVFYTPMTHLRPADERNMSLPAASLSPTVTPARPRFSLINEKVLTVASHTSGSIKENTEAHLAAYDEVSRRLDFTLQQARETLSKSMRSSAFDVDRSVFGGTKEEHGTQTSSCGTDAQAVDKETNIPTPREEKEQQPNLRDPVKDLLQRNSDATMDRINSILGRKSVENDRDNAECSTDIPLPKALGACMSAELSSAEKIWRARLQLSKTRHLAKKYNERLEQAQRSRNADIDEVLNTISLHDASLEVIDNQHKLPVPERESSSATVSETTTVEPKMSTVSRKQQPEDMQTRAINELRTYQRMQKRLVEVQLRVIMLRKKLLSSSVDYCAYLDRFKETVVEECKKALRESNALQKILSMEDLLLEVKRRERKVVDASLSWAEAMKQSLNRDSPDFYKLPEVPFTGRSVSIRLESKAEEGPAKAQNRGVPEPQTRGPTANGDATDLSARSMRRILDARREHVEVMNRRLEEEEKCIEKMTKESIAAQIAKHDKVIVEQNDLMNQLKRLSSGEQYDLEELPPRTPTPRRDGVAPLDLSLLSNDSPHEESKHPSEFIDEPAVAVQVEHAALEMVPEDVALNRTRSQSTVYEDSLSHFSDENDRPPSDDTLYQSDEAPDAGDVTQNTSPQPSRRTLDTAETLTMLSRSIVGIAVTETPRMEAVQELESIVNEASAENKAQLEKTAQVKVEPPHLPSSSNIPRELESIDQEASAENQAQPEKTAQEETPRPLPSFSVAPPKVDLIPAAEHQPQGDPELSRNVSDDKEDDKKEMEALQSPQARTAVPAKDGKFDEYVEDDWLSSDNDESPNDATTTVPAPPPKNFSRLRLFFGSPDEPTKDNIDAEEPEDESANDQFDSRMEPTSAIGDEETKADENDEAEATSGDELVPRITLRKFVYKEPVIGEVYKEDTDLQPTQWETTPPDTPPVEPLGGAHVVQEEAVREEIVFDRSAWVPEGNALQKRQAKETNEKPEDTRKIVATEEKMAGDQKGPEIDLSKEPDAPASAPGDGDSTAQIIPSGPVSAPQAELSTSMICLEKAPVELPPTQDPAAPAALGAGDSTAQIIPSGLVSGVQDEPRTSKMSPIRTPVELPPSQDADESPFLARISDMGLNRSDLCDSLSASMMQILESPRRTSVSQSPRYRYALSDSLLEDSTLDVSAGTAKSPKERFTTKLPRTGMSPEYRSFLNESAENSLLDYIVKSETNAALINEKVEKIEEEIAKLRSPDWGERNELEGSLDGTYEDLFSIKCSSELLEWDYVQEEFQPVSSLRGRLLAKLEPEVSVSTEAERLGEVTPNAALEVQATTLVEPLDESYEDLMSVKEPPSLLHRLHSPSEPSANAVAKYAADTPRKQATRELSPEALKQDRLEKLRERLESVEFKTKTCEQLAEKAWNLIQSQGFMLLSYDSFVPVPESADDIIVDSEDERMLLENHRMTIWTAITEFSAMLWPEHSVGVGLVSTKWLPKPKTAEEFREMAVKYVIEQTSELPPTHRFKRQSRLLPVEENVDADEAAIDEAVARSNCISSSAFARKVHAKYRELCEELIIKVGDLFIASELLHANLLSSADESLLSQSGDISHISEFAPFFFFSCPCLVAENIDPIDGCRMGAKFRPAPARCGLKFLRPRAGHLYLFDEFANCWSDDGFKLV
ncbi:hypothetical protein Q1695_010518 [Nippostrongylus brasiliensis]|nr:hypothetical protein Q1695_010518 [Nippostrongylus brasiliensis]